MVDYEELKKKFPAKNPEDDKKRAATKAAVKRIARDFERKRRELNLNGTSSKRSPLYYLVIVFILLIVGASVLSVATGKVGLGKKQVSRAAIQSRKSIDALAIACGRYKFHVGR